MANWFTSMPSRKRQKLTCSVSELQLPDSLLAKIFSYLPTKERLLVSAVCKQWHSAYKIPWSDIKLLDLSGIPSSQINPVLSLCSVVNAVIGWKQRVVMAEKSMPPILPHLESLKLYHVCFALEDSGRSNRIARKYERLLNAYFEHFPNLEELVWHNVTSADTDEHPITGKLQIRDKAHASMYRAWFSSAIGQSLCRPQITIAPNTFGDADNALAALVALVGLECLFLGGDGFLSTVSSFEHVADALTDRFLSVVGRMPKLRELCLVNLAYGFGISRQGSYSVMLHKVANVACEKLLSLEVLNFASRIYIEPTGFDPLITSHPTLKILAIAGEDGRVKDYHENQLNFVPRVLPGRTLLSPIDQRPLPCLQVFVGGHITRQVQFTLPQPGSAEFTEIDCPMPQFLAKPEVDEIFKDVWIAKAICEGASNGVEPWGSPKIQDLFYSKNSLLFHYGGH